MSRIDCLKCENWDMHFGCKYDFRMAANAGGRGVDCKEDVWFCQDYEEKRRMILMKQLGNLAIVCAKRKDVLFQILNGTATVYVGAGPKRDMLSTKWDDDDGVSKIVHALNFGEYQEKAA